MDSSFIMAARYIKAKMGLREPKTAIILGSGLGVLAEEIENAIKTFEENIIKPTDKSKLPST